MIDTSANRTDEMFDRLIRTFIKSRNPHSTKTVATKTVESPFECTLKPCLKSDQPARKAINAVAAPFLSPEQVETFHQDGVICLRNVISKENIDALRADIDQQISQKPPSETALDLEQIRKEIWGQTAPEKTVQEKTVIPKKWIPNVPQKNSGEVQETQAVFETFPNTPLSPTVSMTQSNAVKTLKTILEAVPDAKPNIDETKPFPEGQFYLDMHQWKTSPNIAHTALNSVIPAICAELLSSKTLQFWGDTTRIKTPNTAQRTSLHQDWAYFPFTGVQSCSVWITLDPSTSENGSPYYIKKSHKWGKTFATNIIITSTQNPLSLYDPLPGLGQDFDSDLNPRTKHSNLVTRPDKVIFDLQPGDIIIHNVLSLHGASGNTSLINNRRALTLRYCGDDIRYFNKPGALETHNIIPAQQDGDPLDAKIFPMVWPKRDA